MLGRSSIFETFITIPIKIKNHMFESALTECGVEKIVPVGHRDQN